MSAFICNWPHVKIRTRSRDIYINVIKTSRGSVSYAITCKMPYCNVQTRFWPLRSGFFWKIRITITKANDLSFHLQKTSCQNSNYKSRYGPKRDQNRKWAGPGMSGPAIWPADQVRTWKFFSWPFDHQFTSIPNFSLLSALVRKIVGGALCAPPQRVSSKKRPSAVRVK